MSKNTPILATKERCTGCLACIDACPKSAISKIVGEDGHSYVRVDLQSCIGCLSCQRVCTKIHDGSYSNNEKKSTPYAVCSKNSEFYERATSGGIFPELATWVINQGGFVYGAAYIDGIHVAHIEISALSDLPMLQGSKYEQSDTVGIYHSIKKRLDEGKKILFSGTGCQVAAVLAYFKSHPKKENIYTADLVCGGVPSSLLMETFKKNTNPSIQSIAYFRQKDRYSFAYRTNEGDIVKCSKSLPLDGFKSSLTNRFSCYNCDFSGIHRQSDWTIGDFWGDKDKTHCKSLCICHNERARHIFESLNTEKILLDNWDFAAHNPRLVSGKCPFDSRIERKHIAWFFKHCSYRTLCKIYASDVKKYDLIWMAYKIYRLIRFNSYFKKQRQTAERTLK